jgi:G:T-mismatch repair DNA endonuclease (very short patch repair protein)
MTLCECGCGQTVKEGNRIIHSHKSKKIRIKLSKALMGHPVSEETIRKLKAHVWTPKQKRKISRLTKIAMKNPKIIKKMRNAKLGKKIGPFTESHRRKMSLSRKGKKQGPMPKYIRKKISRTLKGRRFTTQQRIKLYTPKRLQKVIMANHKRPTSYETAVIKIIKKHGLRFKYVGNGCKFIGIKNPDFINNRAKKIIEVHSEYWDRIHNTNRRDYTNSRKKYFKKFGYRTLVLYDNDLKNMIGCENKILRF